MAKRSLLAAGLLSAAACATEVQRGPIDAHLRGMRATIDGSVGASKPGGPSGTDANARSDFGLDRDEALELGVDYRVGEHRFSLDVLPLDFSGNPTLDRKIVYHGTNFPAGDKVDTDVQLDTWRLQWDYPLLGDVGAEWRAGAGLWWWLFSTKIRDAAASESDSFTLVLPAVTTSGRLDFTNGFGLDGGISIAVRDGGRAIVDLETSLRYRFTDFAWATLGYRYLHYEIHDAGTHANLAVRGPMLALYARF